MSSSESTTAAEGEGATSSNPVTAWWPSLRHGTRMKICYFISASFFAVGFALIIAQLAAFDRSASRRKDSFVVFTDGDIDDLMSLHLLYRRADVEVPLVVVSGNGISSPRAAFDNVRRFVSLCQAQRTAAGQRPLPDSGKQAAPTKVVMGSTLSQRDRNALSSSSAASSASTCSYSRFARSQTAIRVGADTLYGQSESLRLLTKGMPSFSFANTSSSTPALVDAFASAVATASYWGIKTSLLILGPATDAAQLLRSMPDRNAVQNSIRIVVISGGKFVPAASSSSSAGGIADALIAMRDHRTGTGGRKEMGQESELNFFLDPEAANDIVTGAVYDSVPTKQVPSPGRDKQQLLAFATVSVPTLVVPVDVAGSNAAYVDYNDQWLKLLAGKSGSSTMTSDPVSTFLASVLRSYSAFEGSVFFPYKGTPKSIAAVAIALDRVVRNSLITYISSVDPASLAASSRTTTAAPGSSSDNNNNNNKNIGVMTWDAAQRLGTLWSVGRAGQTSVARGGGGGGSASAYDGVLQIPLGFGSGVTSRIFVDSYLRNVALPWPV